MELTLSILYFIIAGYVYYRLTDFLEDRHGDGDPEGLDALLSMALALAWITWVPFHYLRKFYHNS